MCACLFVDHRCVNALVHGLCLEQLVEKLAQFTKMVLFFVE